MKKINLRDYYPYYTQDMIVEVPDEVALLLREYMLLEEAYRIRTYRYKAFYSLDRDEGIEREILQKPLNPAEIWEHRSCPLHSGLAPVRESHNNSCFPDRHSFFPPPGKQTKLIIQRVLQCLPLINTFFSYA